MQHLDHPDYYTAQQQQQHPGAPRYGTGSYQGGYQGGHRGGHQGYRGGQVGNNKYLLELTPRVPQMICFLFCSAHALMTGVVIAEYRVTGPSSSCAILYMLRVMVTRRATIPVQAPGVLAITNSR